MSLIQGARVIEVELELVPEVWISREQSIYECMSISDRGQRDMTEHSQCG